MSDLDIDSASLPSDDAIVSDAPSVRRLQRLPYGTLRIAEEDQLVSVSETLKKIRESKGRHHHIDLTYGYFGDARIEKVIELLRPASDVACKNDDQKLPVESEWLCLIAPLSRSLRLHPKLPHDSFRIVELDDNDLTSGCLPAICNLLTDNLTLEALSLRGNNIEDNVERFSALAKAVAQSALRRLSLSSNPITAKSLAAFLDSIPAIGTALEELELSNLLIDDSDELEDLERQANFSAAAAAVASFIGDPERCRGLHSLLLNGNGFGSWGVFAIVAALCGMSILLPAKDPKQLHLLEVQNNSFYKAVLRVKLKNPNRSLEILELSGNLERGWLPYDAEKEVEKFHSIRKRYAEIPSADIEAIVSFLDQRARQRRKTLGEALCDGIPVEVSRHLPKIGVPLDELESDFEEAVYLGSGMNPSTWRSLVKQQLVQNRRDGFKCRVAATKVFKAARIVGCRASRISLRSDPQAAAHRSKDTSSFYRFLDLPPELRLLILRKLDDQDALSARQFSSVISFACELTTIGYGSPEFDWSRVSVSKPGSASVTESSASETLPAERWSWSECFALRAPPRDWVADLLDASDEGHTGRVRDRAACLEWGWQNTNPSLYAFLESTLTQRADA